MVAVQVEANVASFHVQSSKKIQCRLTLVGTGFPAIAQLLH